jgi:hypothetical protein
VRDRFPASSEDEISLSRLAVSLNNLGIRLSDLDRHEEALAAGHEAVAIRRRLAEACPATFLSGRHAFTALVQSFAY